MRSVSGINNSVTAAYAAYDPLSNKQLIASIRKTNPSAKKKKKHRTREMMEITKADMKYLKAMFEKYEREKGNPGIAKSGASDVLTDMTYSALASETMATESFSGFSVDVNV